MMNDVQKTPVEPDWAVEIPPLAGLDEAGRGPLAGPLVAALVAFPPGFNFSAYFAKSKIRDSKKLSQHQRDHLMNYIMEVALVVDTEIVSVQEIDDNNIGWANRRAFERLIMRVNALEYIVDGNLKLQNLGKRQRHVRCVVRADESIEAVAAASIVAKVTRDRIMHELHAEYPHYGWDHNNGYGTRMHVLALRDFGPTPHHRRQFAITALARLEPHLPGFDTSPAP